MSRWIRVIALTVAVAAIAACGFASAPASTSTTARPSAPQAQHDITGAVDVGGGRRMFVECRGTGSQTVVLIAGKGNGAEWQQVLAPADPVHDTPGDDLAVGKGTIERNAKAVLPSIARFTRVCAYDRPDIRVTGADLSTPRQQPHTADLGVGDLHALLAALGDPGPYVLVAHSYGGLIAELYARTYPRDVAGLAMVDTVTPRIEDVASLAKLANWDAHNAATSPQVREGVRLIDAFQQIDAAPPDAAGAGRRPVRGQAVAAADLLATDLDAEHVTKTNSGQEMYLYSPALVIDAVREVVDDARAAELIHAASRDPRYCQALQPKLAALVS